MLKPTMFLRPRVLRYGQPLGRRVYSIPTVLKDPRRKHAVRELRDEFAVMRESYKTPQHPVVLCHGLMGFDELRLAGEWIPGIEYWRGIAGCLRQQGVEVIVASVPPTSTIRERATALRDGIVAGARGRKVNLIGGIDARYMISKLQPDEFEVLSLTTVATPHHGSPFADYCFQFIGETNVPRIYRLLETVGMPTGAFAQLTTRYMNEDFNRTVQDSPTVAYYSYGACFVPRKYSIWVLPHRVIEQTEGPNDGLVSVKSSMWGTYEGTLVGVDHLGIINWVNRIEYVWRKVLGQKRVFNALAFYLAVVEKLAEKGF